MIEETYVSVAAHYDTLLGPIYSWMLGDIQAAFARSAAEIADMHLPPPGIGSAVDLGAGFGLHAIPMSKLGFKVTALDTCQFLLQELRCFAGALPITAVKADRVEFRSHVAGPVGVVLCAGDTLTHLPSQSSVERLLTEAATSLAPGGMFAATFRDYASTTLRGDARFVMVRRDENRILTCFLEYGTDTLTVHDLLTEREAGQWVQKVSSYQKLRLAPAWVESKLQSLGLKSRTETAPSGMVRVVGIKER
jgi:2-polyprenyl-3-methyl-5-hydroxy-6-metoxy-1,4-benzoquinol methylase